MSAMGLLGCFIIFAFRGVLRGRALPFIWSWTTYIPYTTNPYKMSDDLGYWVDWLEKFVGTVRWDNDKYFYK